MNSPAGMLESKEPSTKNGNEHKENGDEYSILNINKVSLGDTEKSKGVNDGRNDSNSKAVLVSSSELNSEAKLHPELSSSSRKKRTGKILIGEEPEEINVKRQKRDADVENKSSSQEIESMVVNQSSLPDGPVLSDPKYPLCHDRVEMIDRGNDTDVAIEKRMCGLFGNAEITSNISKQRYDQHMGQKNNYIEGHSYLGVKKGKSERNGDLKNEKVATDLRLQEKTLKEKTDGLTVWEQENTSNTETKKCRELIAHLEKVIETHMKKEENMRETIRIQENDLETKNQELLLLHQKVSALEKDLEFDGQDYIEKRVKRGETLVKMLSEEIKNERKVFQEKLGEEIERSNTLSKRVDDFKRIINELVRKIKKGKQNTIPDSQLD